MVLKSGIYAITSPSNKVYIGSSRRLKFRKSRHLSDMRNGYHDNSALQRAWNKYPEQMVFTILEYCDETVLLEREQWWIDNSNVYWVGTYNQRSIAGSCGPLDELTKEKLRIAMTGFRHSEETKQKMRKPKSESHIQAMSNAQRGKNRSKHSSESRALRSKMVTEQSAAGERNSEKAANQLHSVWSDPEKRQVRQKNMRESWTPERRAANAERMRRHHENNRVRKHVEMLNWIVGDDPKRAQAA